MSVPENSPSQPRLPSDNVRAAVSLLLFIHLFCIAVALSGNLRRSVLQNRLLIVLAPYMRVMNLDPDFTRFYLVHNAAMDDDRFLEVELIDANSAHKTVTLPDHSWRSSANFNRYLSLAKVVSVFAEPQNENDTITSGLARSVGARVMRENGAKKAIVRCRHTMSQPMNLNNLLPSFPHDPTAPEYTTTVYEADVWFDDEGEAQVNKRTAAREAAPVQTRVTSQAKTVRTTGASAKPGAEAPNANGEKTRSKNGPLQTPNPLDALLSPNKSPSSTIPNPSLPLSQPSK